RLRRRERLHLTVVDAHLRLAAPTHVGLDLLALPGGRGDPGRQLQKIALDRLIGSARAAPCSLIRSASVAHRAVPPTVKAVTRKVGWPSPTGTPCPCFPQVPGGPMAKSLPTTSMLRRTSGPLPMRLASRRGSVICPFSIR